MLELVAMGFQHQVGHRLHQRMAGVEQAGHRRAGALNQADKLLLEAHALVAAQQGMLTGITTGLVLEGVERVEGRDPHWPEPPRGGTAA